MTNVTRYQSHSELHLVKGKGKWFYITQPYRVTFFLYGVASSVVIPVGFKSDGPSVPWFLQSLVPTNGPHFEAAIVHDYLYATAMYTRKVADDIFLAGMEFANVRITQRQIIYRGVRLGGWVAWNRHRRKDEEKRRGSID